MSYLHSNLPLLYNDRQTSDISIEFRYDKIPDATGEVVHLHKLILRISAQYFKDIFSEIQDTHDLHIELCPVPVNSVLELLKICYLIDVNMTQEQIADLIILAEYWDVDPNIWGVFLKRIYSLDIDNKSIFNAVMLSNSECVSNIIKGHWWNFRDAWISYCLSQPDEFLVNIPVRNIECAISANPSVTQYMIHFINKWSKLNGHKLNRHELNRHGLKVSTKYCDNNINARKYLKTSMYEVHASLLPNVQLVDHQLLYEDRPVYPGDFGQKISLTRQEMLDCFGDDFISAKNLWKRVQCTCYPTYICFDGCGELIRYISYLKGRKKKFRKRCGDIISKWREIKSMIDDKINSMAENNKIYKVDLSPLEEIYLGLTDDPNLTNYKDIIALGGYISSNQMNNPVENNSQTNPLLEECIVYTYGIIVVMKTLNEAVKSKDRVRIKQIIKNSNGNANLLKILQVQFLTKGNTDLIKEYCKSIEDPLEYSRLIDQSIKISPDETVSLVISQAPNIWCNWGKLFETAVQHNRKSAAELIARHLI